MKKALLTLSIAFLTLTTQAQSFRVGLTGGVNSTWLLNENVFDANDELDVASTFGGRFGIEGIYSFNEKVGMSLGINFISKHNQKFTGEFENSNQTLEARTSLSYIDIPLLFRLTTAGGSYFEIGPQFGFLGGNSNDYELFDSNGDPLDDNYTGKSFDASYNSTNVALVFGFGADFDVSENIYITTGLRLGYGFTDVTKQYDSLEDLNVADLKDDSQISELTYAAHFEDAGTTGIGPDEFSYAKTNRAFIGLNLGVSYKFTK